MSSDDKDIEENGSKDAEESTISAVALKDTEDSTVSAAALAKPGDDTVSGAADDTASGVVTVRSIMKSKKESDEFNLAEDVYALMFVAPVESIPFAFSVYVIAVKIIIYSILIKDISWECLEEASTPAWVAKFFLIPVALSMQSDLMHTFWCFANVTYDPAILEVSQAATYDKFLLSFVVRCLDGAFSLAVNFFLMLTTANTLGVFTNFAALYFLQDIDDVFYSLVELGFFGDKMEHMALVCKDISFPRRTGDSDKKYGPVKLSHMDSVMFAVTYASLLIVYFYAVAKIKEVFGGFE